MIWNPPYPVAEEKILRTVISADTANEADDPFAIAHALLTPVLDIKAIIATHYGIDRHADSMERSFSELQRIFDDASCPHKDLIVHGAPCPMPDKATAVPSEGSRLIIEEAMKDDPRPLYAIFLGPLTDLASAYLEEPRIAGRLTAIWIGGGTYPHGSIEFNLGNDVNAVNAVFASKLDLWQVPKNVYEMMSVSLAELQLKLKGKNRIGDFLFDQLMEEAWKDTSIRNAFRTGETWVLGDSPAVGLILYEHRWEFDWVNAPVIGASQEYIPSLINHPIRVYRRIDSRLILEDMYAKIALFSEKGWT